MEQNNIVALMSRITEQSNKLIVQELKRQGITGIVPSHGGILMLLLTGETFTMQDLAERIHRTKPTVTVLVDKLVKQGYVTKEKSQTDSRVTFIKLTEQGKCLRPIFEDVSRSLNDAVCQHLSESDLKTLQRLLTIVFHNVETHL